ncbi:MAG: alpha/beta fold hydrolase [Candidatus Spyradocola sp.]
MLPILLLLCLVAGSVWQAVMTQIEQNRAPAAGEFAGVGAYCAHYYRKGSGDAAFVFIAGSGTPCAYTDFCALQNALSAKGVTVTFDHAGSGWSSGTDAARTIDNLTGELSALIDAAAPDRPVVLICHSLGALEAIRYAQVCPENVRGIVFLDSGSPEFYRTDSEFQAKLLNRGTAFLRTIGLTRLLGELGCFLPIYGENLRYPGLPDAIQDIDAFMYYRCTGNPATLDAIRLLNENAATVLEGPTLSDLPILVLSSDSGEGWQAVQNELAAWSTNSRQATLAGAAHYLHWSNAEQVADCIAAFVDGLCN